MVRLCQSIIEGLSPPARLVSGTIMVGVVGVMFVVNRMYGKKHGPQVQDPLQVLQLRFARGEISREEYEQRRRVIDG